MAFGIGGHASHGPRNTSVKGTRRLERTTSGLMSFISKNLKLKKKNLNFWFLLPYINNWVFDKTFEGDFYRNWSKLVIAMALCFGAGHPAQLDLGVFNKWSQPKKAWVNWCFNGKKKTSSSKRSSEKKTPLQNEVLWSNLDLTSGLKAPNRMTTQLWDFQRFACDRCFPFASHPWRENCFATL